MTGGTYILAAWYLGMQTQVLSARQTDAQEGFRSGRSSSSVMATALALVLISVGHEAFEFTEGLVDFWDGTTAVDEFTRTWMRLVRDHRACED